MTAANTAHTNDHIPTVPVRRDQPCSPLGWHPRQASPRKQAAQIAESIGACMTEGLDWSFADYGIADNAEMIALVQSHLDLEFGAVMDGFGIEEPALMPDLQPRNGTHAPAHTEATVSANCRLMIEGHDVQVTVRTGVTAHEVELVVGTMAGMLRAYANQPPAAAAESEPQPAAQPPGEREVETPYCFEHGQTYRRNEKNGEIWYSHKISQPVAGGPKWCRY